MTRSADRGVALPAVDPAVSFSTVGVAPVIRSPADRRMRRLLRLPVDGPRASLVDVHNAFSRSIAISATRCILTYVLLPLLGPVLNISGTLGPVLGLIIGAVSMVAIIAAARRFFAADHKWRWGYVGIGSAIFVLLIVQAAVDIADLAG
jgi:hypothetical protein